MTCPGAPGWFKEDIMSNKIKGVVLALALAAAVSGPVAAFALGGVKEEAAVQAPEAENSYILRDYDGYVAIFVENEPKLPVTVTDIQVSTLRELDRKLLVTGMKVKGHEELVMILEDIGS